MARIPKKSNKNQNDDAREAQNLQNKGEEGSEINGADNQGGQGAPGNGGDKDGQKPDSKASLKESLNWPTIFIVVAIAALFMLMFTRMNAGNEQTDSLVASEFLQAVEQDRVTTAVFDTGADTITGTYYPAVTAGSSAASAFNEAFDALGAQLAVSGSSGRLDVLQTKSLAAKDLGSEHKYTVTWVGQNSLDSLMAAHPKIKYSLTLASPWSSILLSLLPILLITGVLIFFFVQMNKSQNSQMAFGKAKAKKFIEDRPNVKFSDVAGVDEAVEEMQEVKDFLTNPGKYQAMGAKIPRGCLLVGPPGTGKTLLAKAVAGEAGVPFFSISGSDFVEMFVGVGASRVRDLFKDAKEAAPAIIFIDEIDAVGRQRGAGLGGGHDEREQTLNQLLVEMDGFDSNDSVVLIAATNRSDVLDPALLRPGRFDRQIVVDVPDVKGREKILRVHAANKPLADDVDLARLAKLTPGFTGADLSNLLNEAAILSARRNHSIISDKEVQDSMERVIAGPERKGRVMDETTKRTIAYHESGHALVGHTLPQADPVHKISIISRGRALGYTLSIPDEDKVLNSRNQIRDELAVFLGGRVAEEIFCDDITTGASNDLERATKMARSMVTNYGMSSDLGVQVFGQPNHEVFLGRDYGNTQDYSEETARRIDEEVAKIMKEAHDRAYEVLIARKDQMDLMATVLLDRETVDGEECQALLNNEWDAYLVKEKAKLAAGGVSSRGGEAGSNEANIDDAASQDNTPANGTTDNSGHAAGQTCVPDPSAVPHKQEGYREVEAPPAGAVPWCQPETDTVAPEGASEYFPESVPPAAPTELPAGTEGILPPLPVKDEDEHPEQTYEEEHLYSEDHSESSSHDAETPHSGETSSKN